MALKGGGVVKITEKKIDEIMPYENNPRKNDNAVEAVANSIREFGFKVPIIIDKNNVIIAGHTRVKAGVRLGMKTVPCIMADDLTDEQIKAFRIADNRTAEKSTWDYETLLIELDEIIDNIYTGFTEKDIDSLRGKIEEEIIGEEEFAEELLESHNYVVLYFDNELDWQVAVDKLDLKQVFNKGHKKGYERKGLGRVLRGAEVIERIEK